VTLAEFDRLRDRRSNAAHLVSRLDEYVFEHIGHHQVVFRNHNL
jgi:hypothetical protein